MFKLSLPKQKTLAALLLLSIVANVFMAYQYAGIGKQKQEFELLSPEVAWLDVNEFLAKQKTFTVSYQTLKPQLNSTLNNPMVQGNYGIYLEDLTSGAWLGINEKEMFVPMSLLKVPTMVAVLKKVELGDISLDQKLAIQEEDLNAVSGSLAQKGAGYEITVRDLLRIMIKESDNTALLTFNKRVITLDELDEAKTAMGIKDSTNNDEAISPKAYSNILRSLYLSSYLRRPFSQIALSIMSETDYNTQLPAGVPAGVKVAHKVGFDASYGIYHDCGIIYLPTKPYILCMMSTNANYNEANSVISEISNKAYNHMEGELNG
ncbi:MAG: serine hydrolase [Candidatus Micrarchaeia archaeon]|jgi:beta-lactamase class A